MWGNARLRRDTSVSEAPGSCLSVVGLRTAIETSGLIESKPESGRSFHLGEISVAARASRAALNAIRKNSVAICRIPIRRFVVYAKPRDEQGGEHGKVCIRFAAVLGRLRRPLGNGTTWSRALSSLRRACAQSGWLCVWSPHVRDHALLGRRPAQLGRGGSRLRGGVAKPAEVGCVALVEGSRPQRHAGPE